MKSYHMVQYYKHEDSNPRVFIAPSKYIQGPGIISIFEIRGRCHQLPWGLCLFNFPFEQGESVYYPDFRRRDQAIRREEYVAYNNIR